MTTDTTNIFEAAEARRDEAKRKADEDFKKDISDFVKKAYDKISTAMSNAKTVYETLPEDERAGVLLEPAIKAVLKTFGYGKKKSRKSGKAKVSGAYKATKSDAKILAALVVKDKSSQGEIVENTRLSAITVSKRLKAMRGASLVESTKGQRNTVLWSQKAN